MMPTSMMLAGAAERGHVAQLTRRGGWGWSCTCGAGVSGNGQRRKVEAADLLTRHVTDSVPVVPEDPAKLEGPELGARVRYVNTGRRHGQVGTVTARSYVWAPDQAYHYGDGVFYRGLRRYGDSVVVFDDGGSLSILDRDLVEVCPTCGSTEPTPMHNVLGHEVAR